MSAYVVEKAHINALVNVGTERKPVRWYHDKEWHTLTSDNIDQVGQMLLEENIRSVSAMYQGSGVASLPGRTDGDYLIPFRHRITLPLSPVVILKQIACYKYQACESDDWKQTEAYAFCKALRDRMISELPGYDDAPWGIEEWPAETLQRLTS